MTFFIPDDTAFAASLQSEDHDDDLIDENGNLTPEDTNEAEELEQELQAVLLELWGSIMTECGFSEGTPANATITEEDGSASTAAYNGSDTLTVSGDIGDGEIGAFTLTKAADGTLSLTLSDNLVNDLAEESSKELDLSGALRQYHEERVQSFIDWCDTLEETSSSMTADKAEIIAAADEETKLTDLNGESRTWNASPPAKYKTLKLPRPGIKAKGVEKSITVKRDQRITINTYPIHNFTDGSDWYILKLGGTLNPSGQYNRETRTGNCDIVWGHTGYYMFGASLFSAKSTKITDGITLMDSSPKNENRTASKTVGLTMELNGKLGYSQSDRASGEIGGSISKTDSVTYDIHDYENLNDSSGVTAKVKYNFAHPTKGSKNSGWAGDGLEDAVYTSRAAFTPDVRAVWRVEKTHWQQNGTDRTIEVKLDWADSIARGNYCAFWVTIYPEDQADFAETITPFTFKPAAPMHFALGKKRIAASNNAQAYEFTILSEGEWTAEMDDYTALWCSLNQTSGSATDGDEEKQMMVEVAENTTSKIREGRITFKLKGTNEKHVLTVVQSSTGILNE